MKKLIVNLALLLSLGANLSLAEDTGAFIGGDLGYGAIRPSSIPGISQEGNWRYGLVAGYKEFIDGQSGYRVYANITSGPKYSGANNFREEMFNMGVNADVLHNFMDNGIVEYGFFLGLGVGYTQNSFSTALLGNTETNGFDLGFNAGFRANYASNHGLELWTRFGLIDPAQSSGGISYKMKRPYSLGLRYIFNIY